MGSGEGPGADVEEDVCESTVPGKFGGTLQAAGRVEREAQSGIGQGIAKGVRANERSGARKQVPFSEQLTAEFDGLACGSLRGIDLGLPHLPSGREKYLRRRSHDSEHYRKSESSDTRQMDRGAERIAGEGEEFDAPARRIGGGKAAVPVAESREEESGGFVRREEPAGNLPLHAGTRLGTRMP